MDTGLLRMLEWQPCSQHLDWRNLYNLLTDNQVKVYTHKGIVFEWHGKLNIYLPGGLFPQNESCIDCEWKFPFPSYCYVPLQQDSNGIFYYNCSGLFTKIEYFHELQNLYYSITGEELTIKDKDRLNVSTLVNEILSDLPEDGTLPF